MAHKDSPVELKIAEQKVLSNVFPVVKEITELGDYDWKKQAFHRGEVLFRPDEACNRFMLLGKGQVRVELQNPQGRALLLYRIEPGQLCIHSLINLSNDQNYSYVISAESDGWFCWAEKEQFHRWMNSSSKFNHWILNNIGSRFKQVVDRFAAHAFLPIENRLASLLIEKMGQDQMVISKQSELATELGTAREIVSRHLSRWQKQGLLETRRGGIRIKEIETLVELAL